MPDPKMLQVSNKGNQMIYSASFKGIQIKWAIGCPVKLAVAALALASGIFSATAQTAPAAPTAAPNAPTALTNAAAPDEVLSHPWIRPAPHGAEAYFTNLKEGGVYEAPFMAKFGLSMRGLITAGKAADRAGHHHLLLNQALPLDFTKPLPFSDKYIHFGKGQMEMLVNLPPGQYEFRLLLANENHVLYFVYSKPLSFTISKQNKNVALATVAGTPRIEILSPADRDSIRGIFRVQFHASGYNLSHVAAKAPDTGHFRLTIQQTGRKPEVMHFSGGQTEVWLFPPDGIYSMQLELISNADSKTVLTKAAPTTITVSSSRSVPLGIR